MTAVQVALVLRYYKLKKKEIDHYKIIILPINKFIVLKVS